ncbi:MAG: hypothetical protein M1819_004586 [Sarea resinae]|nr:MAG: hypothetical protein M1819_004586 [Sarea resinae]
MADDKYTDLALICGPHVFKVHRNVICTQSSFFDIACLGQFKEASSREIALPEDDPVLIKKMISFLYHGEYSDGNGKEVWEALQRHHYEPDEVKPFPWAPSATQSAIAASDNYQSSDKDATEDTLQYSSFLLDAQMFAIGDKYGIPMLKHCARLRFEKRADNGEWDVLSFCLAVRELEPLPWSASQVLKDLVERLCYRSREILHESQEFVDLLRDLPEFSRAVLLFSWRQSITLMDVRACVTQRTLVDAKETSHW